MPLPKINHPIHRIVQPSLNKTLNFRPFSVREEKILLMAKQGEDTVDILAAIKQIVNNCCLDEIDLETMPIFDLEWLFLQLRAVSIGNVIEIAYEDQEDGEVYKFKIDMEEIKIPTPLNKPPMVAVSDQIQVELRYPPASVYGDRKFLELHDADMIFELIKKCIKNVWEGDKVFDATNETDEELTRFVESLDASTLEKFDSFLQSIPAMSYTIKYKNKKDNDRVIELKTLSDFFSFA